MTQYKMNIPGWDYLERVTESWNKAVVRHGELMNRAFAEMKAGTYSWPSAFEKWAMCVDSYAETWIETTRGPGYIPRPAWLHFDYGFDLDNALKGSVKLDRPESSATEIVAGPFTSLDGRQPLPNIYEPNSLVFANLRNDEIIIELNRDLLKAAREARHDGNIDGQYLSFVFARNRGAEPPLVITVLTIRNSLLATSTSP